MNEIEKIKLNICIFFVGVALMGLVPLIMLISM